MRYLRILWRVFIETFLGLRHSGWSNWLAISIMIVALTIFGGILQITMSLKSVVNSFGSQLVVSAYLKDDCEPEKVAKEICHFDEVRNVEVITKDVAWEEMKKNIKVAAIANPLPNTLHIIVKKSSQVEGLVPKLKLLTSVESVRYPLMVAKRLNEITHFFEIAGIIVTITLTAATLTVISNTIHLVIQARKREIEILSLMGVGHFNIKTPFVFQGAAYGAVSALISMLILFSVQYFLIEPYAAEQLVSFSALMPKQVSYSMNQTFLVMLVLGIVVGAGGGAWTSGKYIKI